MATSTSSMRSPADGESVGISGAAIRSGPCYRRPRSPRRASPPSCRVPRGDRGRRESPWVFRRCAAPSCCWWMGSVRLRCRPAPVTREPSPPRWSRTDVIHTVFPTTTAAALATAHHRRRRRASTDWSATRCSTPRNGRVVNALTGWGADLDPDSWQRRPTLFEIQRRSPSIAVGPARYSDSGFTRAVLRGARLHRSALDRRPSRRLPQRRPSSRVAGLRVRRRARPGGA